MRMVLVFSIVVLLCGVSTEVFAQAGTTVTNQGLGNPNSTTGLCTRDNKGQLYYDSGYCFSLIEFFTNPNKSPKGCGLELMQRLFALNLGDEAALRRTAGGAQSIQGDRSNPNPGVSFDLGDAFNPPERWNEGSRGQYCRNREQAEKNFDSFAQMMIQWVSAVVEKNSSWEVERSGAGGEGLLPTNMSQMDDPKFECGCNVTNSEANNAGAAFKGPSPGPKNGHHNIMCKAYRMLYWAEKDRTLFRTGEDDNGRPVPKGAAREIPWLMDKNPPARNPDLEYIRAKMGAFCSKYIGPSGKINSWPESDVMANPVTLPARIPGQTTQ